MKRVYADTNYYVAISNVSDQWHALAKRFSNSYQGNFITTEFVLIEVANFLCGWKEGRLTFQMLDSSLRSSSNVTILPASSELYNRGLELFNSRPDKEWSLTDCISFEVMTELEITDALTTDHHFEQAGFQILLEQESE